MPHASPEAGCHDVDFETAYPIGEEAEVALEDYGRALLRSRAAEALRAEGRPGFVRGLHVCGLGNPVTPALRRDLEDFARSLVAGSGGGLGWS
jgi:hypothetical protein